MSQIGVGCRVKRFGQGGFVVNIRPDANGRPCPIVEFPLGDATYMVDPREIVHAAKCPCRGRREES